MPALYICRIWARAWEFGQYLVNTVNTGTMKPVMASTISHSMGGGGGRGRFEPVHWLVARPVLAYLPELNPKRDLVSNLYARRKQEKAHRGVWADTRIEHKLTTIYRKRSLASCETRKLTWSSGVDRNFVNRDTSAPRRRYVVRPSAPPALPAEVKKTVPVLGRSSTSHATCERDNKYT